MPVALAAFTIGALAASFRRDRYSFMDKVVLITGGSRGLGLVLARRLSERGAMLGLLARDAAELGSARRMIQGGSPVLVLPADVTDPPSVQRAIERLVHHFGRVDVVINNAGQILSAPFAETTDDDFKAMLDIHFWGTLNVTRAALPHMNGNGDSRIINICSIGGRIPVPHLSAYCASKYAQAGLSAVMSEELRGRGVRVTTVMPGLMRTGSHRHARFKGRAADEYRLFSLIGGLPLTSMSAERAADLILAASARGDREAVIPFSVRQIAKVSALFPNVAVGALSAINNALPGDGPDPAMPGAALPLGRATRAAITLSERAADRNNER
ncbi:MAG TPA: SDR family NAD(P)-dependent oxidoreductase [Vicinamibacterales bacterium]|jgi:NAD(P)-dependent dehydrogenase (short-subunit alcohol dehydrogenase family)